MHPNSPAAQAGLIPHTDYILGSEVMAGDDDLYTIIEGNDHKQIKLFVYNNDTDLCREVSSRVSNVVEYTNICLYEPDFRAFFFSISLIFHAWQSKLFFCIC